MIKMKNNSNLVHSTLICNLVKLIVLNSHIEEDIMSDILLSLIKSVVCPCILYWHNFRAQNIKNQIGFVDSHDAQRDYYRVDMWYEAH